VVLLLLMAPLGLPWRYSLNKYDPIKLMIGALTPANYQRFFTGAFCWQVMRTTILVSVPVMCLLLGLRLAYRLARTTSRWKSALMLAIVLPLFTGRTVRTVGWMILFARCGVRDSAAICLLLYRIDRIYAPAVVVIGTLSANLPHMVLTLQSVFEGLIADWKKRRRPWAPRLDARSGASSGQWRCPELESPLSFRSFSG
jgi:putative spermidine/putrescine transport system permease protein